MTFSDSSQTILKLIDTRVGACTGGRRCSEGMLRGATGTCRQEALLRKRHCGSPIRRSYSEALLCKRHPQTQQCIYEKSPDEPGSYKNRLAGLAMQSVLTAAWAELIQLQAVWSVTTVLRRNVVALLALSASKSDARTNIVLSHVNTSRINVCEENLSFVARERLELSTLRL